MSDRPTDIKDEFGNVISLVIRRQGLKARRFAGKCTHTSLVVDTSLTKLECKDCGKEINAVEWIATTTEYYAGLRYERERYNEAKSLFGMKSRCKCEHCGKLTRIKPATSAEVRQFQKRKV
jgi:ribosomal protein S27E